jgi:metal-responsive CopG/Arc/MetJ family transcriptional regulator
MMRNTRKPRVVAVKLEEELDRELTEMARRKNVSRSMVVREALRAYAGGRSKSALELAGDAVGSLRGPGDLSTNKDRLKDFGK